MVDVLFVWFVWFVTRCPAMSRFGTKLNNEKRRLELNPETLKAVHLLANKRRAALGIKRPISKQTTLCVLEAAHALREEIERVKGL